MMKVTHFTSVHPENDTRIFIKECSSLAEHYEVSYVVPSAESYQKNGVNVIGINAKAKNRLLRMLSTTYQVYKKCKALDSDVYHFHDPELLLSGLLLKGAGKAVIYDVHEDVPEQILSKHWIPKPIKRPLHFMVKAVEKFCSKRFDAVITATPAITDRFKTYNENTVTVQNFPIMNELAERGERKTDSDHSIVYVGSITAARGIKEMIEAINEVNKEQRVTLELGGKFFPETLLHEMRKLPGWKHTNYMGVLQREQVKDTLAKSSLGMVLIHPEPRYKVAYPVKLFEYMSAGLPVIVSDFELWEDIVYTSRCGLCVNPLDVNDVKNAIAWMLSNPDEALAMGRNGRKAVEQQFNWEKESRKLIALYEQLGSRAVPVLEEEVV
ncbi:glycosyltransferase family 4 protein [Fictibacillus sp. KIGAM418]|uniref:Glycosyltransferase family 4 protein n=1 Tax=Fictibacillus marinisediminis TaxID=2878389 RepID=A0A9X2BEC2_9BACL|nr:glycosyltransferase family 4 protein [Fictibacillus marinisediminis]MCK6258819.1 glycosyltransferase family 4 protein [Fictibacillus marinisediminis]